MSAQPQKRIKLLYVVYWGAAEPLGQSLVLPSVKKLAKSDVDITLVTFEKPSDLEQKEKIESIKAQLQEYGIQWIILRYHKRPKVPATLFDVFQGWYRSILSQINNCPDVIHARTFIGGLIGQLVAATLRAKFIYHNEGFYPEEQVDSGVWSQDSFPYRIAKYLEQKMYASADAIISLSQNARTVIEELPAVRQKRTPVIVVPSCVDLSLFKCRQTAWQQEDGVLRFVYIGSVGGRYSLDKMSKFVHTARQVYDRCQLLVLTGSDHQMVKDILQGSGLPEDSWIVDKVPYAEMPAHLLDQHVGLHFLNSSISQHGGSPTKIGEYWAAGLPVVTTPRAGDSDEIIEREKVGVIVKQHSEEAYATAVRDLLELLNDTRISARCRRAAEAYYALEPACESQIELSLTLMSTQAEKTPQSFSAGIVP